jgi:hypothetical protein
MLYFYMKPLSGGDHFSDIEDAFPYVGSRLRPVLPERAEDRTIDSALRSVTLPEGLLARLGALVYTMSDESTDQVDYLGC